MTVSAVRKEYRQSIDDRYAPAIKRATNERNASLIWTISLGVGAVALSGPLAVGAAVGSCGGVVYTTAQALEKCGLEAKKIKEKNIDPPVKFIANEVRRWSRVCAGATGATAMVTTTLLFSITHGDCNLSPIPEDCERSRLIILKVGAAVTLSFLGSTFICLVNEKA